MGGGGWEWSGVFRRLVLEQGVAVWVVRMACGFPVGHVVARVVHGVEGWDAEKGVRWCGWQRCGSWLAAHYAHRQ